MKIDDITTLRSFKLIYETKSLTKASEIMALSKAALSKRLDALEQELEDKLFSRTTRSIIATQSAHKLYPQILEILEKIDALALMSTQKKSGKINIKVTCIASMSQRFMGKLLQEFQQKHPHVEIELLVTDSLLDLVEHNIDLAIRVNPSKNSTLVGKRLGEFKLMAVASPGYLKKFKKIKNLEDLLLHKLLFLEQHASVFNNYPKTLVQKIKARRAFTTNDSPLITLLVLSGQGVAIRSSWDVKEPIETKKLSLALPRNFFSPQGEVWLLSGPDRLQSPAVRSLFDFLSKSIVESLG